MKRILSTVLVAGMAISLAACTPAATTTTTAGSNAPAALPKVGATIYRYDDNFMSFVRNAMEREAKDKVALTITDSQNDQGKQNEQVDTFLSQDVKVLAINLVTPQAAQAVIDKAKPKNIPIVFFNKEPDEAALNSYDKAWYVGTRSAESGEIQGQLIVDQWKANAKWDKNGDGKIQYVMIKGEPGHPDAEARTKYSIEVVEKAGIGVEKLDEQTAMWDTAKAKDLVDAWIAKYGDKLEFVIANNDSMALGALASLQNAGYTGDKAIPIVGVDAIPDALTKIESGELVGTVLNDAGNQGKALIDLVTNLANGKEPLDGTEWKFDGKAVRVPYKAITKANLQDAKASYGQ